MSLPKYLSKPKSVQGQQAEKVFAKKNPAMRAHARSGAGIWEKDDLSIQQGARIEYKLVCRGTSSHVIRWASILKLVKRAEQRGQIPVYIMNVQDVGEFVLLPRKYLKGV
jgi:hypothetical protein